MSERPRPRVSALTASAAPSPGPGPACRRRRGFLTSGSAAGAALLLDLRRANAAIVAAVRVWPSEDYTRVTIELDEAIDHTHFTMGQPDRVVVDLPGITVDAALRDLVAKVVPSDPYIERVRMGQFNPETMRLVFDLKQRVKPQVFTLDPVGPYRHRLVIDLYPSQPPDGIDLLIAQLEAAAIMRGIAAGDDPGVVGATPANRTPALTASASGPNAPRRRKTPVTRLITVALDPGHGGEDPGAIGPRGTREKDVVLAISARVKAKLEQEANYRVFLTRDRDFYVPLSTRVSKARAVNADLFVSVHADAFTRPAARGSSVFVLSDRGASSVEARWLANRENRADKIGGVSLKTRNREAARMLMSMMTASQIRDSTRLGDIMLARLGDVGDLHKPRVEQAGFAVLKAPDIPSILIETAFISNPQEEMKLRNPRHQDRIAEAIATGIRDYFRKHPPAARNRLI